MTITTAKLARAVGRAYARPLALPLALGALLMAPSARADWNFTPTLRVGETWTDNVGQRDDATKESSLIHEITPGFMVAHKGPRLVVNGLYELRYYDVQNDDVGETNRSTQLLRSDAKGKLVEDLLYFDANASIRQQAISAFGPATDGNDYSSANRTEVKSWRVSPYLVHRFGPTATSELRYVRDSVDAGHTGLGNTDGDTVSFRLNSGPIFKRLGWGLAASHQKIRDDIRNDSEIKTANLNLRYLLGRTFNVTGNIGYDDYDYEALGGANRGKAWDAGFAWTPSTRTSLQASVGRRYYGPSRTLSAMHRSRHTVWSIQYNDTVSTTRANFLIPSAIDTAALLDGLFLPTFPDPDERARAVEAYIRATGLPPSLADNINYFSNRYVLQKQLRASMAYRAARSSTVFSVFRIRRDALSVRETDSVLLGNSLSTVNDDVKQAGINITMNYRLTPRTNLNLVGSVTDSESLTTGFKSRSNVLRFNARHQLGAKMFGAVELRHIKGNRSVEVASPYTENAVSASLNMQL
jgi:uncharacterized protein (PEP-CTERM system associated)